jgi:precorrin-8X/cobalt-precorrin-8 methylmutase
MSKSTLWRVIKKERQKEMLPAEIENKSFEIIKTEAGNHGFSSQQWTVVSRMIHTSADFDYLKTVRFHDDALSAGINAIRSGKNIVTDTHMAEAGIRKKELANFGCQVSCLIDAPDVIEIAGRKKTTRAFAAVDAAVERMKGGIYVVGNAPTALLRLLELIRENKALPSLIVGLPVGFVNAEESKDALVHAGDRVPYITNVGRKGGSNVAAAVINALMLISIKKN